MPETSRGGEVIVIRDQTLNSISSIKVSELKNLESNSHILTIVEKALETKSSILKNTPNNLESRSNIFAHMQRTLNARSAIKTSSQENIETNSCIKTETENTITSRSVISVPCLAGDIADEMWMEFIDGFQVVQKVVYKDYPDETEDGVTGQKIKGTADEYNIFARVEVQTVKDSLVKVGTLDVGDARIFLPARIRYDTDWTPLSGVGDIRPHKFDEIVYKGFTYRVKEITFSKMGKTEILAECYCTRVKKDKTEAYS